MSCDLGQYHRSKKTDWLGGASSKVNIKSTNKAKYLLFGTAKDRIPSFVTRIYHEFSFVSWAVIWPTSRIWPFVNQFFAHCISTLYGGRVLAVPVLFVLWTTESWASQQRSNTWGLPVHGDEWPLAWTCCHPVNLWCCSYCHELVVRADKVAELGLSVEVGSYIL